MIERNPSQVKFTLIDQINENVGPFGEERVNLIK
jgi:hypothetical protein